MSATPGAVVIPVKRFSDAKRRLAGFLDPTEREALARSMATRVLAAAHGLQVVVVSDDDDVATWARSLGAHVVRDSAGGGLNGAVRAGVDAARDRGAGQAVIIHADIPLATSLQHVTAIDRHAALIVPDSRNDGTNVLVIPTDADVAFHYGPGSFALHHRALVRLGLAVTVMPDAHLGADVDHPRDLAIARRAGLWPFVAQ